MSDAKAKQILGSSKVMALGLLDSIAALAYFCAKLTRRASRKLTCGTTTFKLSKRGGRSSASGVSRKQRRGGGYCGGGDVGDESFGEDIDGVWRKSILMGDKCEPLDFSGVIYYDCNGNILPELPPKSPRATATPFTGHHAYN